VEARAREAIEAVEGVLRQLARDEDFQDDLKQPQVIKVRDTFNVDAPVENQSSHVSPSNHPWISGTISQALKHWTNQKRMDAEEANRLGWVYLP